MKTAIINTNVVLPDYMIRGGTVIFENDRIVAVGKSLDTSYCEIIDANGLYTGPGLVDIHTHSDGETLFYENPEKVSRNLLEHGITDVLPTLYFSDTAEQLIEQIRRIKQAKEEGVADNIEGLYMEAPYMNPKFGCNRENNPWRYPINKADYEPLVKEGGDFVKVWVLAPEREGICEFVKDAKRVNPEVVFSVGHSEAEPENIEPLMKYGLCLATHHMNATGTIQKYPECRSACVDETALYNDSIYTELICDKVGIHVAPYLLRLVKKIKGDDKIILISDAFVAEGPTPDGYEGADDINFDLAGEIAGSKMILDSSCRNMMFHTGASLCQIFKYASRNPARAVGLLDRGEVAVGNKANLILVDAEFNVKSVIHSGNIIK